MTVLNLWCITALQFAVIYSMHLTHYAVRYLLSAVGDPASYELVQSEVRPHLAGIVRQQTLSQFPCKRHCYCDAPAGGRMVACDGCDRWYHAACLSGPVGNSQWLCRHCKWMMVDSRIHVVSCYQYCKLYIL